MFFRCKKCEVANKSLNAKFFLPQRRGFESSVNMTSCINVLNTVIKYILFYVKLHSKQFKQNDQNQVEVNVKQMSQY